MTQNYGSQLSTLNYYLPLYVISTCKQNIFCATCKTRDENPEQIVELEPRMEI